MKPHDYQAKNRIIVNFHSNFLLFSFEFSFYFPSNFSLNFLRIFLKIRFFYIKNDVIFVWYSKMIKSVEEGKEKLEHAEENSTIFDVTPFESLRRKLRKEETFNFFTKKSNSFINNIVPKKRSFIESSYLQSEKETIKSAVLKRKDEINSMVKSMGNLLEFKESDDFLMKESEEGSYKNLQKEFSPLKLIKREKVYINQRNIYYDKDGNF